MPQPIKKLENRLGLVNTGVPGYERVVNDGVGFWGVTEELGGAWQVVEEREVGDEGCGEEWGEGVA